MLFELPLSVIQITIIFFYFLSFYAKLLHGYGKKRYHITNKIIYKQYVLFFYLADNEHKIKK